MSASQRNDVRAIAVDPSLGEILRQQTLLVLEANHAPFDDVRELALPSCWRLRRSGGTRWRSSTRSVGYRLRARRRSMSRSRAGTPPSYVACGETRPLPSSIALRIAMRWLGLTTSPRSMRRSVADVSSPGGSESCFAEITVLRWANGAGDAWRRRSPSSCALLDAYLRRMAGWADPWIWRPPPLRLFCRGFGSLVLPTTHTHHQGTDQGCAGGREHERPKKREEAQRGLKERRGRRGEQR
jgi:hypothetical protein